MKLTLTENAANFYNKIKVANLNNFTGLMAAKAFGKDKAISVTNYLTQLVKNGALTSEKKEIVKADGAKGQSTVYSWTAEGKNATVEIKASAEKKKA